MNLNPIPYYYEAIDRNAIIIKPKKPFFDWLNSVAPNDEPITGDVEGTVYLIGEKDSNEEILKWLARNFNKIFINELNEWFTDEELWPGKRTFKMFSEWFAVDICSMVLDLEDYEVSKD